MISINYSLLYRCSLALFSGYPHYEEHFFVEADPVVKLWANALNEVITFFNAGN